MTNLTPDPSLNCYTVLISFYHHPTTIYHLSISLLGHYIHSHSLYYCAATCLGLQSFLPSTLIGSELNSWSLPFPPSLSLVCPQLEFIPAPSTQSCQLKISVILDHFLITQSGTGEWWNLISQLLISLNTSSIFSYCSVLLILFISSSSYLSN